MLLFVIDLVKKVGELEYLSYFGCIVSIIIFYFRMFGLYSSISLIFPHALTTQILYLCIKQYFQSTINYLLFDGCIFSSLFLLFHLIRFVFFGKLNQEELSSINDMLASTTLFRLVFMFYVFYYYNDLSVFEFAFWSIITEITLCLKAISHLVIIRCKLVPQQFAFDQALPISTLFKYTFLTLGVSLLCSSTVIYLCYSFFYAQTGAVPLLCLLFDTIVVVFDNIHALGLITVHFYRKNTDIYVYYTDLLCNVFTEMLKMMHYFVVIYVIGISFSLIGVYVILRVRGAWINIRGNIKAYRSYQQIYQALNHQYPDATRDELLIKPKKKTNSSSSLNNARPSTPHPEAHNITTSIHTHEQKEEKEHKEDSTSPQQTLLNGQESESHSDEYELCGICRDGMTSAKKLPCSHKFHLRCLMGWMRYKHTCPICRRSLNNANDANSNANNAANPANGALNNANNAADFTPWWLRLFGNFIQIHNVDIIDVQRGNIRGNNRNIRRQRARHAAPNNISTEEQIQRINEILGGRVSEQEIRIRLLRTHSMERTIEYFLNHP